MTKLFLNSPRREGSRAHRPAAILLATVFAAALAGQARGDTTVDFVKDVQPVLEFNCVHCHHAEKPKGKFNLADKAAAFKGGKGGIDIVAGDPAKSPLYTRTQLAKDDDDKMPPMEDKKDMSLSKADADILKNWIAQGAKWPDGVTLQARKIVVADTNDDKTAISTIYKKIVAAGGPSAATDMKPYNEGIPGSKVTFDMLPIPAGSFTMGSPATEAGRAADEGPQHKVTVSAFWMEKCEVTWNEFELFMYPDSLKATAPAGTDVADAVTHPTKPYVEMSFGMGKDGFPAISMTQHAANTYCKWLSAKTGHFYRLPTEAEWEYACRAGTTTAYSFGDDASKLSDYAWYAANSSGKYQLVGTKKTESLGALRHAR